MAKVGNLLVNTVVAEVQFLRTELLDGLNFSKIARDSKDELKIERLTKNFFLLVAKNRRLFALSDMIKAYRTLVAQSKGEISAEVISADDLSPKHLDDLKAAIKASVGRDVQLSTRVDPSILGGLIVKVGSRMVDNSLKTKLQNLKIAMKGTG